ncbi:MAG TPA: hypothetical protein VLT84_08160 [Acidobacteriota bacterium]|nr:hypothetical protein [Acidobacteriota bacterium]
MDATGPTEFEMEIVRSFERQHRERGEPAGAEVHRLTAQFTTIEASLPTARDLTDRVAQAAGDVDREVGSAGELATLWAERERRLRDLRVFARDHGLARDAHYPASAWLHFGIVAVLLLVEACANAWLFSEAADFGLLGGFLGASGVALVNVGSAFATGRMVLPWLAHRSRVGRVLGFVGLVLAVAFAGGFNLVVAAYRDRLASGTAAAASLHDLLGDPFGLGFLSAALLATGLLTWGISLLKGYTSDDGYPFYGVRDRAFRNADRAFLEARDEQVARVVARVQRLPLDLQEELGRGRAALSGLDAIVVQAYRVRDGYETDRADIQARCTALLKAWREENLFVRTSPPPAYFAEYPAFTTLIPEEFVRGLAERAARARAIHADLEGRAHGIVLENSERITAALARVEGHVEEMMRRGGADRSQGPGGRAAA